MHFGINQLAQKSSTDSHERLSESTQSPALLHLASLLPTIEFTSANIPDYCEDFLRTASDIRSVTNILSVLHRSRCHHTLLVGHKGCGKSSVLILLAEEVLVGRVQFLVDFEVLYIDATNVGHEDSRALLETLFDALQGRHRLLLLIDGFSSLFLRPGGGTNKPLIRTLLSRPGLRFVGTMQTLDYNEQVANDSLMLDHFCRVDCEIHKTNELEEVVRHFSKQIALRSGLTIASSVAERTLALTSTFLVAETEPSRTTEVLRRAVDQRLFRNERGKNLQAEVTIEDVAAVLSKKTGMSPDTILGQNKKRDFTNALAAAIVGQSQAVQEVAIELEMIAAGLNDPYKPATVLMFAGLTGVGKTELAKQIARLYSPTGRLKVYPMGNFTEPHSVSGLVGVPPGYVGHEEGGRLINDLLADPYSVFLLDEAEKCHPNVWKPFLTLFDEGWILDQRGRKAYGDRAIFILTTNAGDRSIAQLQRSGKSSEEISDHVRKTLSRVRHERSSQPVFPPQFLSRIRKIVIFNPLTQEAMEGISAIFFQRMVSKWQHSRGKTVAVDAEVIHWVGMESSRLNDLSNGEEGGRIVQKLIAEKVEYEILKLAIATPDEYDQCASIIIKMTSNAAPQVVVKFTD